MLHSVFNLRNFLKQIIIFKVVYVTKIAIERISKNFLQPPWFFAPFFLEKLTYNNIFIEIPANFGTV